MGPSRPRKSAPARVEQEIIVIDSSSDEEAPPPPPQPRPAPKPTETITISSSDSDQLPRQAKSSPTRPKRPQSLGSYQSAVARATASGSQQTKTRPKPQSAITRKLSLSTKLDGANLPLPPSERDTPSPPQKSPSVHPSVYRTSAPGPSSDGDSQSQSSSEMIETRLVGEQEQKSV
ncbi:hypothetical protein FRC11_001936, partial [Ceratobasidium sp. 423]